MISSDAACGLHQARIGRRQQSGTALTPMTGVNVSVDARVALSGGVQESIGSLV